MESSIKSLGIIGLGAFGKLCAQLAPSNVKVVGYDSHPTPDLTRASLAEVCATDVIILAVPLSSLESTLESIKHLITPSTLVIDICSVKVNSSKLIKKHLPNHKNILISHPLFGPQTIENGTAGKTFVVCEQVGDKANKVVDFCKDTLELKVVSMSPEQHDKEMSKVHALTLFLARGLSEIHAETSEFSTASFDYLKKLVALDHAHSEELFLTIQNGNPYAKQIRSELIETLEKLNRELEV